MKNLHQVQMYILRELLFHPGARFSELNTLRLASDHFTYHLAKLVELGLVSKDRDRYSLTSFGKEFANWMDTENMTMQKQAKLGALVCGVRKKVSGEEYLVQTRLKEPFYGYHGFITGKIKYGETIVEAAKRELKEEANLTGKPELFSLYHLRHFSPQGALLKDQFFWAVKFVNPKGKLRRHQSEGENQWLPYPRLKSLDKLFPDFLEVVADLRSGSFGFRERDFTVEEF